MSFSKETTKEATSSKLYCDVMHLPFHTTLPDGTHVTIDAMTDLQISQVYRLITTAAKNGLGFVISEFPDEEFFRQTIKTGHSFIATTKESGEIFGAFFLTKSIFFRGSGLKVADPFIIVPPSDRARGVGTFLTYTAVLFAKRLGYAGIYWDVLDTNTAAKKILENSPEFKRVGHLPMGGTLPDGTVVGVDVYFMDLSNLSEAFEMASGINKRRSSPPTSSSKL